MSRKLQAHMPAVGLHFSKIDIMLAHPLSPALGAELVARFGGTCRPDDNFEAMRSPIGEARGPEGGAVVGLLGTGDVAVAWCGWD